MRGASVEKRAESGSNRSYPDCGCGRGRLVWISENEARRLCALPRNGWSKRRHAGRSASCRIQPGEVGWRAGIRSIDARRRLRSRRSGRQVERACDRGVDMKIGEGTMGPAVEFPATWRSTGSCRISRLLSMERVDAAFSGQVRHRYTGRPWSGGSELPVDSRRAAAPCVLPAGYRPLRTP